MKRRFTILLAALLLSCGLGWAQTTDVLNHDLIGVTGTSYSNWSGKTSNSDAVYAGNTAGGNNAIQMRSSNNNSGIVTTASGGVVTNITVVWNENTTAGRTLNVYGKNAAYSAATDLYGNNAGTLIGTIVYNAGASTELDIDDEYAFIGIRSNSGALYLNEVSITWSEGSGVTPPSITVNNVEITYDTDADEIEYEINNAVDGGVLTASTESDWLTLGEVGATVPFTCSVNEAGAAREAVVTLTYTYGEQAINQAVTVTQAGNPNAVDNISDITATGAYAVQGTIVAKSQRGFIVGDGTGYVYYYNQSYNQSDYAIGDMVKLAGSVVVYGGVFEFNNSTTVTPANSSNYVAEEPTVITGEEMDARVASTTPAQLSSYVQYEGTLSVNDTHYNITNIAGATTAIGSISYPLDTELASLDGKQVRVTGYYVGISSSKYYNTMIGSVEEVVEPTITVTPMTVDAPAEGVDGNFTVTCANVGNSYVLDVNYYTSDGTALNLDASPDWISYGNLDTENATSIGYYIDANTGAARTAYLKIQCLVNGAPIVESGLITINQAEYVAPQPSIDVTPMTVDAPAEGLDGNFTVTCANVGDSYEFDVLYCTSDGTAVQGSDPDWIGFVNLNTENVTSVGYIIAANEGEARTAYLKIQCLVNGAPIVESELITINQAQYVVDYATLPFEWEGGASADFLDLNGVTAQGLGSDYASGNAPYLIKFDGTGDYIQVKCDQQPGKVTIGVKMIGGSSTSTITIQGSADGETFTDIQELTISGVQNDVLTLETTTGFAAEDRYVKMLFTKGSNVGVGPISIAVPSTEPSITVNPDVFDLDAAQHLTLQMPLTYENLEVENYESFAVQFYDTNNEPTTKPDWIFSASVTGTNDEGYNVTLTMISANEGEARSAYLKVFALDETDNTVYSNLVTINQEAYVAPPTPGNWVLTDLADLTENDVFVIVGDNGDTYAMPNDNGTSNPPAAVAVTVAEGTLSAEPAANLQWNISITDDGYTFYPNGETESWLYCTNTNNGVRVGTNTNNVFVLDNESGYLKNVATSRYIGIYNSQDWRCYTSEGGNIADQTFAFYKKVLPANSIVIEGYGESEGGYYLIASPFTVSPADVQGMTEGEYDLYSFDEAEENEWRNYKADAFENLEPGKGYLYAHSTTVTLTFDGTPYDGEPIVLKKTAGGDFPGWNLVGNPYTETAYIDRDFYVMNPETGGEIITGEGNEIAAMQGFFVIAANDGEELEISTTAPANQGGKIVMNVSNGRSSVIDRAMVRFGEGRTLPKFMLNDENTKIYITEGNEEFAVVRSIDENATPVSFHAAENGTYTLSINAENVEMEYLHLLDNMTGADVDLLATPSYTFEARTTDYANRFKLVYATTTDVNENNVEPFAFFNGSEWVINNEGEATLQVIDINGRMLSNETVNGNANVNINATSGIYMLRLVNGESVKTQKVVVK